MPDGSNAPFIAARPTLALDGQDHDALTAGLLGLEIVETATGLYRCEALFGNWGPVNGSTGFLYFGRDILEFGKTLEVKLGSDRLFKGRIDALEARFPEGGPPQVAALAEDRLQDLRMTRRTRSFENVSDSDVMQQVANAHGLTPDINLGGGATHKVLAQVNQSDLAFLRDRARALGAELWVDDTTLKAAKRSARATGAVPLAVGGLLREFSVIADLAGQRTSVVASGWDVAGKSALSHDADDSVVSSEVGSGDSGPSILAAKIGTRKETCAHGVPHTQAETQALAEALMATLARRFVVGRGVAQASAALRVGAKVDVQSAGALFSGEYYVCEVRHRFDGQRGLRTEFRCERPAIGQP
jgi:phage protein D